MENNRVSFFAVLRKNIIYICLMGIVLSICLAGVKYLFSDIAVRHGDYLFIQTIQVENQTKDNFDYKGFLESPSNYYQFMRTVENGDFDFTKIDSAWKQKSQYEQMDWLKKKIQVAAFRDNVFEVTIHLDANITRDIDYMKDHGALLAEDFVAQSEKSIKAVKTNADFKVISTEASMPVIEPINRKTLVIKFAVIGFIVGIIGSAICFYLWEVAKEHRRNVE